MSDQLTEWIQKAESDFDVVGILMAASKIHVDSICFHAQQCVEKYLKAVLVSQNTAFEKTHNLIYLLDLVLPYQPLWESWRPALRRLNDFAIQFRYPGEWADSSDARNSIDIMTRFRIDAREALDLHLS